jgi:hypothetical protein
MADENMSEARKKIMAEEEEIPEVNYTGTVPCDCCGSLTQCSQCEDPAVAEEMHRLLWMSDYSPMDHHIHLCGPCEHSGCTFGGQPDGERCGDHDPETCEKCNALPGA